MTDDRSTETTQIETTQPSPEAVINPPPTPLKCFVGSVLAGVFAYAAYLMTSAIAQSFATHKIASTSLAVQRISSAVRTLVIGMTTLGAGVFGLAAIGLLGLAIQLLLQRRDSASPPDPS